MPSGEGGPGLAVGAQDRVRDRGVACSPAAFVAHVHARAPDLERGPPAGSDSACVSRPMNSGPVYPFDLRYRQIASVVARMWASLKAPRNAEPRWPEVPKATRWAGSDGSGWISW